MNAVTKLLDRLERVRPTGPGRWLACCPAHEDGSPSLSIREMEDGRVLLNDFGGCETQEILDALGLSFSDLFERSLSKSGLPATHSRIPARELLDVIGHESMVVALIAAELVGKRTVSEEDWKRLAKAVARIGRVRDYAYSGR